MAGGLTKLGIEKVPPIATRGVLLDMAGYFNTDIVKEGTAFNRAEIEGAMKRQGIKSIERGDVVLFHTGWTKLIGKDNKRYGSVEPGLGVGGARYLAERQVAMVGADTWGLEVVPFEKNAGRVRGAPDPAADERHLHPREHGDRGDGEGPGVGVPVHARPLAHHRRGAGDHQPDRDQVNGRRDKREFALRRRCMR